jgi:hypothetical protein
VAKACQANIKKEYKLGVTSKWSYFFAKAILQPNKVYNQFNYPAPQQPHGDYLSRQITMNDCLDCCKRLVKYVETNKRMPNYIAWKNFKISPALFTEVLSRVLIYLDTHKTLPKYANINSKAFTEETETVNEVYSYFVKVFGSFDNTIDGALQKIAGKGYGYYYDDVYSNKESINRMKTGQGVNCTDSCQVFYNIMLQLIKLGKYKRVECLHVKCTGGDGHVRLRITLNDGDYIYRDPAAVLDSGNITHNWCSNGTLLAVNPGWFLNNINR